MKFKRRGLVFATLHGNSKIVKEIMDQRTLDLNVTDAVIVCYTLM